MKKEQRLLIFSLLFLVTFLILLYVYLTYLSFYPYALLRSLFAFLNYSPVVFTLLIVGSSSLLVSTFFYQLLVYKKLSTHYKDFLKGLYLLFFIYIIFLKTPGVQGFNINPLRILEDIRFGSLPLLILNILLLVPMGFSKLRKWHVLAGLIAIELIQYFFALGIFDITDILLNFLGFLLGRGLYLLLKKIK